MPASFLTLAKQTLTVFKQNIAQILVAAAIIALFSSIIESSLVSAIDRVRRNMPENTQEQIETGTGTAIAGAALTPEELEEAQVLEIFFTLLPRILFTYVAIGLLSFLSMTYYFVLALESDRRLDWGHVADRVPALLFRLIGLYIWILLRSFAWVPFIGFITSIYYIPRFALSGVILASENKGIIESARESLKRSHGFWWKIFSNALLMGLIIACAVYVLSIAADLIGILTLSVVGLLFPNALLNQLSVAAATIFTTLLAKEVLRFSGSGKPR